jgi:hypothetical protein
VSLGLPSQWLGRLALNVSLQEGRGSLVGSGLAAQASDSTVNEAAVEFLCRCSARELSRFKTAGEDRETGQNREAVAIEGLGWKKSGEHEEEWWRARATAAAQAANTASSSSFAVSCVEDVMGKEERRKRYSNWAMELGCARDRAGLVTKEADGLSGKKIKWADLIFELCFYYLLSLLRGEKFLWGFFTY